MMLLNRTLVIVLVISAFGLALAEAGRFSAWGALTLAILVLIGAFWRHLRRRSSHRPVRLAMDRTDALAAATLLVAAVVFFRPFENVYGGRDGGVYVNTGVHLARTGSIPAQDAFLAGLPATTRTRLLWTFPGAKESGLRFKYPGFFWIEPEQRIVPQFMHAYPALIAVFYSLFGLRASLYVTSLLAWLSLLAIYLAGRQLFDRRVGLMAMLLLLVNPGQIWFARYANADVGFQFLFLAGLVFWARFVSEGRVHDGLLSGAAFGTTLLFKLDASFLLAPVGLVTALAWLRNRNRPWTAFAIPWLGFSAWGLFHALTFSRPYTEMSFGFVVAYLRLGLVLGGLILAGLAVSALVLRPGSPFRLRTTRVNVLGRRVRVVSAALLLLVAAYLYFVLPAGIPALAGADRLLTGSPDPVHQNLLQELGWYLTPLGLFLAVAGAARLIAGRWNAAIGLLLLTALAYLLINLRLLTMGGNDHIWAIRRHISVVMPCAALFAACAVTWPGDLASRHPFGSRFTHTLGNVAPVALFALVAGRSLQLDWPLILHREFGDALATVAEWVDLLPPDSVTVFEVGMAGNLLAPPLTWQYDRQVLVLWEGRLADPDNAMALASVAQVATNQERPLYVVTTRDGPLPDIGYDYRALAAGALHVPELERAYDHLPQRAQATNHPYRLYRLVPGPGRVSYEAESLQAQVAMVTADALASEGRARHAVPGDGPGFLAYGPYVTFLPGRYEARFLVRGTGPTNLSNVIAVLDVAAQAGNMQLARRELTAGDLDESSYQTFSLVFDNPATRPLEFRVAVTGAGQVWFDAVTVDLLSR